MSTTSGFLKFNNSKPRVHVTADDEEFDSEFMNHLQEEGFETTYVPYNDNVKEYRATIRALADGLQLSENFAIISFGKASTVLLDHLIKPMSHCVALIAYYPSQQPKLQIQYPASLEILLHLAGTTQTYTPAFRHYTYAGAKEGFAEFDLMEYDSVSASLSWSRTLGVLRHAFGIEVDLEKVWEQHMALEFETKNAAATMATMVAEPYVNHVPTLTGGIGQKDLHAFYRDHFIPQNPPSLTMKLVSRTIGIDRVVDEMIISFRHTTHIPWMLPDVPPTNKIVHVALVSIVCIRGGKLYHEHIYWDQASVLVQIGLLDPKLVPDSMKSKGLKKLPVYGAETAAKVLDKVSQPSNALLSSWKREDKALPIRGKQQQGQGKKGNVSNNNKADGNKTNGNKANGKKAIGA
ncbi:Hypothetical protein R9X50_00776400 [Acrodontium crateriforme]|uniref:Carboxymethylenebutenolidase n=1 Tax=Acrodontium crateriforme TaxID=150365 RepID=A0AAQ3MBX8_9PEZI|nr:Hypothetical protein R9X50_00776400 [Acrodontium crateriforme]